MITLRKSNERGSTQLDWLQSWHSFSFNHYYDPSRVHFGPLRVLNDDVIAPGTGFGAHPHQEMEIVTYVLTGALEHRDSTGGQGVISASEVQRMTAGTGIVHSEFNHSKDEPVHLLQIWMLPNKTGLAPGYEQKRFTRDMRKNVMLPVATPTGEGGAVHINQDVTMYISTLETTKSIAHTFANARGGYLFIASGSARVNQITLGAGDAAEISGETALEIVATAETELVLFDVPLN